MSVEPGWSALSGVWEPREGLTHPKFPTIPWIPVGALVAQIVTKNNLVLPLLGVITAANYYILPHFLWEGATYREEQV